MGATRSGGLRAGEKDDAARGRSHYHDFAEFVAGQFCDRGIAVRSAAAGDGAAGRVSSLFQYDCADAGARTLHDFGAAIVRIGQHFERSGEYSD